jgi:gluconate 2-dehydrogenase gamma chain
MAEQDLSRRTFVARTLGGAGSTLLLTQIPYLGEAQAYAAARQQSAEQTFLFFTPEQAVEIAAVCEQIIPTDDTPGAREAGAVFFIDYALAKYEAENRQAYVDGLRQLADAAAKRGAPRFSALSSEQQIQALTDLQKGEFFALVRRHTILGFVGDPIHKGNRGRVGWKHLGFDYQDMYEPPFGDYAELLKKDG